MDCLKIQFFFQYLLTQTSPLKDGHQESPQEKLSGGVRRESKESRGGKDKREDDKPPPKRPRDDMKDR